MTTTSPSQSGIRAASAVLSLDSFASASAERWLINGISNIGMSTLAEPRLQKRKSPHSFGSSHGARK